MKVARFSLSRPSSVLEVIHTALSRTSSVLEVICTGLSRLTENPCSALGGADMGCAAALAEIAAPATRAMRWAAVRVIIAAFPSCRREPSFPLRRLFVPEPLWRPERPQQLARPELRRKTSD